MQASAERAPDDRAIERRAMVRAIADEVCDTEGWTGRASLSPRVMAAMAEVPRHEFVPASHERLAYRNAPLPIGRGQTISQPYIVALMTDLADLAPDDVVLEVGTGSGYQAAVLSRLVRRVYSVERDPQLSEEVAARLARLGYANVEVRTGDGYLGWPEHAPYDAILVTAAAPEIPPALVGQLAPDGRLVLPIDAGDLTQDLTLVTRREGGELATRPIVPVAFVPLVPGLSGAAESAETEGTRP